MSEKHSPLPCPFCGCSELNESDTGVNWVNCPTCAAEGPVCDDAESAITRWNTRAVNGLPEAIAALEVMVAEFGSREHEDCSCGACDKVRNARAVIAKLKAEP